MKVIMDISKDILTDTKGTDFDRARNIVRSYQATIADAIQNSIVLPDNATNGDMIKAIFPDVIVKKSEDVVHLKYPTVNSDPLFFVQISKRLWNAPYKGECNLSEKSTGSESEDKE